MKIISDFMNRSSEEFDEILSNVIVTNNIKSINEDLMSRVFRLYIGFKIRIGLCFFFYVFILALLSVYIISSQALEANRFVRYILVFGILRYLPILRMQIRDELMEKFSNAAVFEFKNNPDEWHSDKSNKSKED